MNWTDYGARWYDPVVGRFPGVDPVADKIAHLSTYNYASNNPVSNIDLWGLQGLNINGITQFLRDVKDEGFGNAVKNYFDVRSFVTGDDFDKASTVSKIQETGEQTRELGFDAAELVVGGVENASVKVAAGAATITFVSGGTTAAVTGPIIGAATFVSGSAYAGGLYLDVKRDGNLDTPVSEIITEALFTGAGQSGKTISKHLKLKTADPKHAEQTESAVESIWSILINLVQEASNKENSENGQSNPK